MMHGETPTTPDMTRAKPSKGGVAAFLARKPVLAIAALLAAAGCGGEQGKTGQGPIAHVAVDPKTTPAPALTLEQIWAANDAEQSKRWAQNVADMHFAELMMQEPAEDRAMYSAAKELIIRDALAAYTPQAEALRKPVIEATGGSWNPDSEFIGDFVYKAMQDVKAAAGKK